MAGRSILGHHSTEFRKAKPWFNSLKFLFKANSTSGIKHKTACPQLPGWPSAVGTVLLGDVLRAERASPAASVPERWAAFVHFPAVLLQGSQHLRVTGKLSGGAPQHARKHRAQKGPGGCQSGCLPAVSTLMLPT